MACRMASRYAGSRSVKAIKSGAFAMTESKLAASLRVLVKYPGLERSHEYGPRIH